MTRFNIQTRSYIDLTTDSVKWLELPKKSIYEINYLLVVNTAATGLGCIFFSHR